jgi:hypothetical protein
VLIIPNWAASIANNHLEEECRRERLELVSLPRKELTILLSRPMWFTRKKNKKKYVKESIGLWRMTSIVVTQHTTACVVCKSLT